MTTPIQRIQDALVGDQVVTFNGMFEVSPAPTSIIFSPAKVIEIDATDTPTEALLCWSGDVDGSPDTAIEVSDPIEAREFGVALGSFLLWVPVDYQVHQIIRGTAAVIDPLAEKPCLTCQRPNYLSAANCWSCGNHPFR